MKRGGEDVKAGRAPSESGRQGRRYSTREARASREREWEATLIARRVKSRAAEIAEGDPAWCCHRRAA